VPSGTGTPTSEYAAPFATALARCRGVGTLQAELSLSGKAGRQTLRGRALAGFAPGALRLEAIAPFGSPAFILVADGSRGTLLLPRDRRILQDAAPEDILNALIGVPLGPDDLRAVLSGCMKANAVPQSGREFGPDWMAVDLDTGGTVYLHRVEGQPAAWRVVAGRYAGLDIEYPQFAGDQPAQIVIRSEPVAGSAAAASAARATADVALTIGLSQVEVNGDLPRDQLVAVKIPPGLQPITLTELRAAGPLGR
jgi:hypothetical protein